MKPGKTVVHEERTMDQLYNRDIPVISEENSYDPNRDAEFAPEKGMQETEVNPLAYLTGRVEVKYGTQTPEVVNCIHNWISFSTWKTKQSEVLPAR